MSGKVWGLVWERFPGGEAPLLVMLAMGDVSNHQGRNIFPSVTSLAIQCRIRKTSCTRILKHLKGAGWIAEESYYMTRDSGGDWRQVKNSGRGHLKVYRMNLKRLHEAPAIRAGFDAKAWKQKDNLKSSFNPPKGSPEDTLLKGHPKAPFIDKGCLSRRVKGNPDEIDTIYNPKTNPVVVSNSILEPTELKYTRRLQQRILTLFESINGLGISMMTPRRERLLDQFCTMGWTVENDNAGLPWRDDVDALGWVEQFVAHCNQSDYLKKRGRVDFEWLLDLDNVAGMLEARYHDVAVNP